MTESYDPAISDLLCALAKLSDDTERAQAKLNCIISMMEGETANFSASIYVPLLAGFALAVANTGLDPIATLVKLSHHSRAEVRRQLKEAGIHLKKPLDA